jgi:methylated-DNA-[protein]-cysteine S-methyltransferase
MEMKEGSCRLGLWHVHVYWDNTTVQRVRFHRTGLQGPVPSEITRYLAGSTADLSPLTSPLLSQEGTYGDIYREVYSIPYGSVASYGEIARRVGTSARVVGLAMMRNITPLIVPCHRVTAANGIGGFTPDIWIKEELLRIESTGLRRKSVKIQGNPE